MWIIIDVDNPNDHIIALSTTVRRGLDFQLLKDICMMWDSGKGETTLEYIDFLYSLPKWKVLGAIAQMQKWRWELTPRQMWLLQQRSDQFKVLLSLSLMQKGKWMITPWQYRIMKRLTHTHNVFRHRIFSMLCFLWAERWMPEREELEKLLDCCWVGWMLHADLLHYVSIQYRGQWLPYGDEYDVLLETCLHRQRANHTPELLKWGSSYKRPNLDLIYNEIHHDEEIDDAHMDDVDDFITDQKGISVWSKIRTILGKNK